MNVRASVVGELESLGYALLPESGELAALLADAYAAWGALFASGSKFALPGNRDKPAGYIPMCGPGGCDMKESYYFQTNESLPPSVDRITRAVTMRLMAEARAIADEVNAAAGFELVRQTRRGCLRIMRYPAFHGDPESPIVRNLAADGGLRACVHTDLNAITLLPSPTAPGLEAQTPDGEWRLLDGAPGFTVVQIGQEAAALSNGRFRATVHRVRNPLPAEQNHARMSLAMFFS